MAATAQKKLPFTVRKDTITVEFTDGDIVERRGNKVYFWCGGDCYPDPDQADREYTLEGLRAMIEALS